MKPRMTAWIGALILVLSAAMPVIAHDGEHHGDKQETGWPGSAKAQEVARAMLADSQPAADVDAQAGTSCVDGFAGEYPCSGVDLMAFLPLADIGGGKANDIWGWTDASSGKEYALLGRTTGTSFVDITDPVNPVYLGNLPTTRFSSTWRDLKVHGNHVFVVSESRNHGMQVFDLRRLRTVTNPPVTFSADARYTGFATAHNIAINEASGFAYAVGTDTCSGGLHMVDIRDPLRPSQAGCYSTDGYTHDVQCVNYAGPDTAHHGREICFASNEDTVTVVDVTNKAAPVQLARVTYPGVEYTHQGWLTEDQRYFLVDDELDESRNGHATHTYVFDFADVDSPALIHTFAGTTAAIDHNQYIVGNHSYQSNYRGGLRIIDISNKTNLEEVAFFDTYPQDTTANFNGSWSNYPFFDSGMVAVSDIERGLFILRPNLGNAVSPPAVSLTNPGDGATVSGPITVTAAASDDGGVTQVEFFVDGSSIGLDSDGLDGWSIGWDTTTADNGNRTLTATATDNAGQTSTDEIVVTVDNPNSAPTASFTYTCVNLACDFDGTAASDGDGSIVTYAWNFGDGSTGSGATVSKSFATGGEYAVTLTVTDNDGATATDSEALTVDGPATGSMHVGDLDGRAGIKGKSGRWEVFVTVTVHDGNEQPVGGAMVTGTWSGSFAGAASGTTAIDGTVTLSTGTLTGGDSVTFSVTDVSGTLSYESGANHDPDGGDSNGTSITETRPT